MIRIKPVQSVAMGFASIILIGAVLLTLPCASKSGTSQGFLTALFTATSATCVTGLVVVDTYTTWTIFGQIVILLLIQTGGLGFMIVATIFSLILGRKISFQERLVLAESINKDDVEGVVNLTRKIILGTFLIEGTGAALLSIRFIPMMGIVRGIYYGIFHAISAFCNAGFDIMGRFGKFCNFAPFVEDPLVNLVVMVLIIMGGLGFTVQNDIFSTKSFSRLHLHTKIVVITTASLLIGGFLFFYIVEYNNPQTLGPLSPGGKILAAMFMSVTPRTAGFNTISQSGMRTASAFFTIFLMFIGGSPGSTAGGIKTTTIAVMVMTAFAVARGHSETDAFQKRIPQSILKKAFVLAFIGFSWLCTVTMVLVLADNVTVIQALFESASAFGTVGLTLGITPTLSTTSRIALIVSMYFGRVGMLSIIAALSHRPERNQPVFSYPEEKIAIG